MKLRTTPILAAAALTAALAAAGCSSASSSPKSASAPTTATAPASDKAAASMNIVQIAESDPDFSTLVAAVKAAGLASTLEGSGPFTVFAPTNAAFAALPAGTLQTLLQPAHKAELTSILTYHVTPGALKAADIMPGAVKTVNGASFTLHDMNGTLTITDSKGRTARIVRTDIVASNGVIHVIDAVLLPPAG